MQLTSLTLSHTSQLLSRKEVSPVELVNSHLERIKQIDPKLNCFITVTAEAALQSANEAKQEIMGEEWLNPLKGVPLAIKDLYETRGVRTTAGSTFFADYYPKEDGVAVQKLVRAGGVLLGKLNMHEIALGVTNVNPHYGACHNPWDLSRISGGSSGGSAAALAAGLCMGSLGTDTGGSIRIPAALCGVVGLKPTYGRVSLRGILPLSWNLDHAGPMARRVVDVALLLQQIAGFDAHDPYSLDVPTEDYLADLNGGVRGWRIALAMGEFFTAVTDPEILLALEGASRVFTQLGAAVQAVEVPQMREAAMANGLMTTSDAAAYHRDRLTNYPEKFGDDVRQRLQTGAAYSSTDYALARRQQSLMRHQLSRFFEEYDILLTPTTPVAAPLIEGPDAIETARLLTRFTAPFNLTGLPALSLPCGFTSQGLPMGLQIISRPWAEAAVMRAAQAFEQATEWHLREPSLH